MADAAEQQEQKGAGFRTLVRFLPMLWPKGETELKARVIAAVILVLAGKAVVLAMPFAYKAGIDRMSGPGVAFGIVAALVASAETWEADRAVAGFSDAVPSEPNPTVAGLSEAGCIVATYPNRDKCAEPAPQYSCAPANAANGGDRENPNRIRCPKVGGGSFGHLTHVGEFLRNSHSKPRPVPLPSQ